MHQVRRQTPESQRDKILAEGKREKIKKNYAHRSGELGLYICEVDPAGKMIPGTKEKI